jgi:hypothetical protein
MLNSEPPTGDGDTSAQQDADVNAILRSGATGAVVLAGLATAIVVQSGSRSICSSSCRVQSRHDDTLALR